MKVLVTGAAGFIGCQVARVLLDEGHEVCVAVRPCTDLWRLRDIRASLRLVEYELSSHESTAAMAASVRPERCFHLAAASGRDLDSFQHANHLRYSLDLALALANSGCEQFVGAGTNFEYDTTAGYLSESTPLYPQTLHAAARVALHTALRKLETKFPMKSVWTRPFFMYGPLEDARRLVPAVIDAIRNGRTVETSSGEQIRDYLHVRDVASGICAAARAGLPVANIGSGDPVRVRDIVLRLARMMNGEALLRIGALPQRPGDPPFICANTTVLRSQTGWTPKFDLDSGLRDTIESWAKP